MLPLQHRGGFEELFGDGFTAAPDKKQPAVSRYFSCKFVHLLYLHVLSLTLRQTWTLPCFSITQCKPRLS